MNQHHVYAKLEMKCVFRPANPDMSLSEAKDAALAAGNRLFDYGDSSGKELLVGHERSKLVLYAMVPELCPPGATLEQMIEHMKSAGFDVRGEGTPTLDGHRTVLVCETEIL